MNIESCGYLRFELSNVCKYDVRNTKPKKPRKCEKREWFHKYVCA